MEGSNYKIFLYQVEKNITFNVAYDNTPLALSNIIQITNDYFGFIDANKIILLN